MSISSLICKFAMWFLTMPFLVVSHYSVRYKYDNDLQENNLLKVMENNNVLSMQWHPKLLPLHVIGGEI